MAGTFGAKKISFHFSDMGVKSVHDLCVVNISAASESVLAGSCDFLFAG